jgi:Predicted membrane protein (DUF2207)
MLAIAIVAAAGWLTLYAGCAAVTYEGGWGGGRDRRRGMRRFRLPGGPPDLADPALVNLVTTGCQLDAAAFAATILQLGSRRVLAISEPEPGQLWCTPTREGAGDLDLAAYERLVLADVTRQFAEAGGAPFQALADMCFADVKAVWDPFEEEVRAEGRRRGLTRARLPKAAVALLFAGALVVAGFAAAAVGDHNSTWWVGAGFTGIFAAGILVWLIGVLGRGDRLTPAGAALAAWAIRMAAQSASLAGGDPGRLALAAATAGAPPVPGQPHIRRGDVRQGGHRGSMTTAATPERLAQAPKQAWSSRDGQWRLVPVGPRRESPRMVSAALLAGSVVALLAALGSYDGYQTLQMSAVWILVPAGLLAGGVALGVAGVRAVTRWLALPPEVSFDGQVIARWTEESSDGGENSNTVTHWCLALDDGERAWTFDVGQAAFGRFALGTRIRARIAPRSMRLLDLVLIGPEGDVLPGQPRWGEAAGAGPGPWQAPPRASLDAAADDPAGPEPGLFGPLVTAADVEAVLGSGVRIRGKPTPFATAYRGDGNGVTVSLITTSGRVGEMNARAARRSGRPLPGIGAAAWLINRGQTAVVQAGGKTVKLTVRGRSGRVPPGAVTRLAQIVAERLAERSEIS